MLTFQICSGLQMIDFSFSFIVDQSSSGGTYTKNSIVGLQDKESIFCGINIFSFVLGW